MKLKGMIIKAGEVTAGVNHAGRPWSRQEYVLEYKRGDYPKCVAFSLMNDMIEKHDVQQGAVYEIDIDFEVREHGGRFYMSAIVWDVRKVDSES